MQFWCTDSIDWCKVSYIRFVVLVANFYVYVEQELVRLLEAF